MSQPIKTVKYLQLLVMQLWVLGVCLCGHNLQAATLTLATNVIGSTPSVLAYNSGHFVTNSNTKDWWRYSGVNGARVFLSPSEIEPSDDIAPVGDGVNSQATFISRKAALRANPLNLSYINWAGASGFSNRYESNDIYPNNHFVPNYAFREMRKLGVKICVQITASESRLPIADTSDWPNIWELWQHYYAQAFYLARVYDVERYQMFNEPNHPNANGLTITNHLFRLQLVSDAVQAAISDVNAMYGKSLSPKILAPVTSGSADSGYVGWGESVVTNRHLNYLRQTDTNFSLIQIYDYHQYGSSPSGFGGDLALLCGFLSADMSPEPRYPVSISEFNTDTGASFDSQVETLDTPSKYARFGAIVVNLMANECDELYCFKFSQTARDAPTIYPVAKNAMHYVDNNIAPYNVGGITKAGEVYRLFVKAFAAGRSRVSSNKGSGVTGFDVHASYDPIRKRYYLYSVNNTASSAAIDFSFPNVPVPVGNRVLLEEVSEDSYGVGKLWTNVPAGKTFSGGTQPAYSVWLLTIPVEMQGAEQVLTATADADVRDGSNKGVNYGLATSMTARNDPTNTANRSVAFMKFDLTGFVRTNIEFAVLSFQAASASTNAVVQAHVYALDSNDWSQSTITWSNAPNLKQNITASNTIAKQFLTGVGDSAHIVGQVVASSNVAAVKMIDVTDWLRTQTNSAITFLVSQDPRWDVTLPSLATGDTQPAGIKIITTEGGSAPQLRIVLKSNAPPIAQDDVVATVRNQSVIIDVLANDIAAGGGILSIINYIQPVNGSVSNNGNGILTYMPAQNFTGSDAFTYVVADSQGRTNSATVWVTVSALASAPYWTNLGVSAEAFVRGGINAASDQDETATGYIMVKYNAAPFDSARKAYFQFDLSGLNLDAGTQAVFTVGFLNSYKQNVQLWALDEAYPNFSPGITWNVAQANDTNSNRLLVTGDYTASAIGVVTNLPASGTSPVSLAIPYIGNYLFSNRVTLVLTGETDSGSFTNNSSGLRMLRTNATLRVLVVPGSSVPPRFEGGMLNPDNSITLSFRGDSNKLYWLQSRTDLTAGTWAVVATNLSDASGLWSYTELGVTNNSQRYFRAVLP